MKIYDTDQYNEKLKINPVKLDDFDKLNSRKNPFEKNSLETYDIVDIQHAHFIVYRDDFIQANLYMMKSIIPTIGKRVNHDVILFYDKKTDHYYHLFLDDFDDELKHKINHKYDIGDIYRLVKEDLHVGPKMATYDALDTFIFVDYYEHIGKR